jgi:hypothetical protein
MSSTATSDQPVIRQVHEIDTDVLDTIAENNRLIRCIEKYITGEKWLTCEEAAKYIKKSATHLRGKLKDQIGYSKPERELLFKVEDLDRWLMKHYTPAKD